ncbi:mitogen-activated protein kinase-binding protein 1 isoform x4 [Stylonychia lemnae]|uniref:Mitogen-activated protein kinase-binding protein 1 isoform x4 n=1 Tax=Stylonychia lemnae TaxID=5949 RepID=A0A078ASV8_STYLE|nr:mitogen-activated protein kinase-binding protein 1 isoform x4 [Stylonychia lemnae]|eukprot:CDW83913.1 mitogen-activated protein kinase-binding protein 1 isoform x4 [Stylonychia lemnae]
MIQQNNQPQLQPSLSKVNSLSGANRPQTSQNQPNQVQPLLLGSSTQMQLMIQKILGTTSNSKDNFVIFNKQECLYLSQSFLVIYDFVRDVQVIHFQNPNNKPYRALLYDKETQTIMIGEGNTKQGEIHILKIQASSNVNNSIGTGQKTNYTLEMVMVLKGHKYGIKQIQALGDIIISVGDEIDKGIIVWETVTPRILSANLIKESRINGAQFYQAINTSDEGGEIQFITYGQHGHLKLWSIEVHKDDNYLVYSVQTVNSNKSGQSIPKMIGNKIIFMKDGSDQDKVEFTDLIIHKGSAIVLGYLEDENNFKTYSISRVNLLSFKMEAQYQLPYSQNNYLMLLDEITNQLIVYGSFQRLQTYDAMTLKLTVQKDLNWANPPQLGILQMISQEIYDYLIQTQQQENQQFAQTRALIMNNGILIQILEDGMILIHDYAQNKLIRVMIQHFNSINDLQIKEYLQYEKQLSFFTCSSDNTLRMWNTCLSEYDEQAYQSKKPCDVDLKRIVRIDESDQFNEDEDQQPQANNLLNEDLGIKCLAYNKMRNQLAVGDMVGNLRLYQMSADNHQYLHQINYVEAHEGKVVTLQYSEPFNIQGGYVQFLISASSDRMIHIFNATNDEYELIQTIDVHTTSIVDAKFAVCTIGIKNKHKIVSYEKQLRLYTCSTDKTVLAHKYNPVDGKFITLSPKDLHRNKIYKMAPTEQNVIFAKDQGIIEIKSIEGNKSIQNFQQSSQNQSLSKSLLDYTFMTISQDSQMIGLCDKEKSIQIRDVRYLGNLLSKFNLADSLSSLQITSDNQYVIASSQSSKEQGGGLIYIFKVENNAQKIKRMNQQTLAQRNADKLITVDTTAKPAQSKFEPKGFEQLSNMPQARKFTVREDLYNTWAKSTNKTENQPINTSIENQQIQSRNIEEIEKQQQQIIMQPTHNLRRTSTGQNPVQHQKTYDQRASNLSKESQISPTKIHKSQTQAEAQVKDIQDIKEIDDFINEMVNDDETLLNDLDTAKIEEDDIKSPINGDEEQKQQFDKKSLVDSEKISIEELSEGELDQKIQDKMKMTLLDNTNINNRSTLNLRNSLTMKYLIETPRAQNMLTSRNTEARQSMSFSNFRTTVKDDQNLAKKAMLLGLSDKKIEEVEEGPTKDDAAVFNEQLDRVMTIINQQIGLPAENLEDSSKVQISMKINRAIGLLTKLQTQFLEQL